MVTIIDGQNQGISTGAVGRIGIVKDIDARGSDSGVVPVV